MNRAAINSNSRSSSTLRRRQNTASGKRSTSSSSLSSGSSVPSHLWWERPPAARTRATNFPGCGSAVGDTRSARSLFNAMMMMAMIAIAALSKVGGAKIKGGGNAVRGLAASAALRVIDGESVVVRLVVTTMMMRAGNGVLRGGSGRALGTSMMLMTKTEKIGSSARIAPGRDAMPPRARAIHAARSAASCTSTATARIAYAAIDRRRATDNGDTLSPRRAGGGVTPLMRRPRRAPRAPDGVARIRLGRWHGDMPSFAAKVMAGCPEVELAVAGPDNSFINPMSARLECDTRRGRRWWSTARLVAAAAPPHRSRRRFSTNSPPPNGRRGNHRVGRLVRGPAVSLVQAVGVVNGRVVGGLSISMWPGAATLPVHLIVRRMMEMVMGIVMMSIVAAASRGRGGRRSGSCRR